MTIHGRLALVTGANKGIGLEIARQLAQAGVHVFVGARDGGRGQAAAADLAAQGLAVRSARLDLLDEESVRRAAELIGAEAGRLDILVNNAGIFDFADGPPAPPRLRPCVASWRPTSSAPWR